MNARVAVVLALVAVLGFAADYKEEFSGKVVLVTGGSSGIGFQTALEFAQNGAKVIIVARDSNPAWFNVSGAAQRINDDPIVQQTGGSARPLVADVSNNTQMKAVIDDIRQNEDDLHFAVNAAGIGGVLGRLHERREYIMGPHCAMRNNIYGTLYSMMYELRFMNEKNRTGAIVNFASTNGVKATPNAASYGASKFGIVGLTRCAAAEHAVGTETSPLIRVNAIAPTLTDTSLTWQQAKYKESGQQPWEGEYITPEHPLWQKWGPIMVQKLVSKVLAAPKFMADTVLFLCSSDATYITGQVVLVDRGATA